MGSARGAANGYFRQQKKSAHLLDIASRLHIVENAYLLVFHIVECQPRVRKLKGGLLWQTPSRRSGAR